jgi:hypothetical protein
MAKLNSKKTAKKSSFYEEKSLVRFTPDRVCFDEFLSKKLLFGRF